MAFTRTIFLLELSHFKVEENYLYSLVSRPLPDFIAQPWRKSGSDPAAGDEAGCKVLDTLMYSGLFAITSIPDIAHTGISACVTRAFTDFSGGARGQG